MKREKTAEERMDALRRALLDEWGIWEHIRMYGCSDPFHPDGVNMNLIRNHIIASRRDMQRLAEEAGTALPETFYWEPPDPVNPNYMCPDSRSFRERWKRQMMSYPSLSTQRPPAYEKDEIVLF